MYTSRSLGFQSDDPATDFRGMGALGLSNLLYLSTVHRDKARALLALSADKQYWFPFAITGINITNMLFELMIPNKSCPAYKLLTTKSLVCRRGALVLLPGQNNTTAIDWCTPWAWMTIAPNTSLPQHDTAALEYYVAAEYVYMECSSAEYVLSSMCAFHELYCYVFDRWIDSWQAYSMCVCV